MDKVAGAVMGSMRDWLERSTHPAVRPFLDEIDWAMPERRLMPHTLPCLTWLDAAAANGGAGERAMAELLAAVAAELRWGQTYSAADFGPTFVERYGWTEIFGTRGHFSNERVAGGFLVLGPHIHYPDHHHVAEELYVPLTGGTEWRKGDGPFALQPAGTVIHHPSEINHAMRTGEEPLLALYLWRGGPLDQRSTIAPAG